MTSSENLTTFYVSKEANEKLIIDAEIYEEILFVLEGKRAEMDEYFVYGGSDDIFDRRTQDSEDVEYEDEGAEDDEECEDESDEIEEHVNSNIKLSDVISDIIDEANSHEESEGMTLLEKILYGITFLDNGPGLPDDVDYDDYFEVYQSNGSDAAELQRMIEVAREKVKMIIGGDDD